MKPELKISRRPKEKNTTGLRLTPEKPRWDKLTSKQVFLDREEPTASELLLAG